MRIKDIVRKRHHSQMVEDIKTLGVDITGIQGLVGPSRAVFLESDFLEAGSGSVPGLTGATINSGTVGIVAASANHPGVVYLRDSATSHGGYRYMTNTSSYLIAGGEKVTFIFQARSVRAASSFRLGFQDSTAIQTQPTDGAWLQSTANGTTVTLLGRCKNNAGPSDTADAFTLALNTWYKATIEINADASLVTFKIFSEVGAELWSRTVSGNIPNVAGRETGFGVIAGESSTDAAADIIHLDYMSLEIARALVR